MADLIMTTIFGALLLIGIIKSLVYYPLIVVYIGCFMIACTISYWFGMGIRLVIGCVYDLFEQDRN